MPRLFEEVSNRVEVEHLGGMPLLRAATIDPKGWQFAIKYAIDRIVAGIALLLISPLLLALAFAVRLTSAGPVFYRQRAHGARRPQLRHAQVPHDARRRAKDGEADAAWAAAATGEALDADAADAPPPPDRRTPIGRVLRSFRSTSCRSC